MLGVINYFVSNCTALFAWWILLFAYYFIAADPVIKGWDWEWVFIG